MRRDGSHLQESHAHTAPSPLCSYVRYRGATRPCLSDIMLWSCNMRATFIIVRPFQCFPNSIRMLSADKCLLNVYQMMAVHCLLFLENGDMCKGVVSPYLDRAVNPLWPSGAWPGACYPVFTSQEQNRTFPHLKDPNPRRPEIRLHSLF